jgi:signal transduction histidine kinase/ActR/RegA family two-component response regulator
MVRSVRKIPVLRYFLIVLLFSGMFIGSFYLYLRSKKAKNLRTNIENLISERENSSLIDSCIINLYRADNNSRLYTLTGNKHYLKKFTADIARISEAINRVKFRGNDSIASNPEKFKELMTEKTKKTGSYIKLRLLTDSLIKYSANINKTLARINLDASKPEIKVEHTVTIDTIKTADNKTKKKLLGRLISALSPKQQANIQSKPLLVKDTVTTTTITPKSTASENRKANDYYQQLNTVNNKLRTNEQQMLLINNNLIEEIIASLQLYKSVEQVYMANSKAELKENLANVYFQFGQVSALNFIFLFSLLVLVFYNIWKIYRNEQEIIFYSDRAEQYADSKSRFLAGMSHEIRTPLNSVIGFAEQLSLGVLSAQQQEQVDAIRNSSEMLLELVNEILDFSKYETGKMNFESAPFGLHQAVEDVFTSMNIHALKKRILLENDVVIDDSIWCEGDKMRLKQVIMNLLGNAIKFTVNGKVTLSAHIERRTEDDLLLKVTVADTGLGIDKNDLPFIFDEFSQVANAQKVTRHKGTGLGLAICKKIIELQGGSISVASAPGHGSAFSFELPLRRCEMVETENTRALSDELMADIVKDKYVLFAEDNQLNVLLGSTILKKWGIKHDAAYNGHDAMLLFRKNKYDLVLTDIQMPELNGIEVTKLIRNSASAVRAHVPILALTANVLKEDRDLYLRAGINDVVLKPFREKDLIEKIALALQTNSAALRFVS